MRESAPPITKSAVKTIPFPKTTLAISLGAASFAVYTILQNPVSPQTARSFEAGRIPAASVESAVARSQRVLEEDSADNQEMSRGEGRGAAIGVAQSTYGGQLPGTVSGQGVTAGDQSGPVAAGDGSLVSAAGDGSPASLAGAGSAASRAAAAAGEIQAAVLEARRISVPIPLAFRPLPPEAAAANPELTPAVQDLQQDFVQAMGGPNQDPNSPEYLQRWIAAANRLDDQYHVLVGDSIFLAEQMQTNSQ